MLERTTYCNDHLGFERENYFRYRQLLKQQGIAAKAHLRYPREKLNVQHNPSTVYGNGWQIPECLAYKSYTSVPKSQAVSGNSRLRSAATGGLAAEAYVNTDVWPSVYQPLNRHCRRVKQNTSAFRPLHTEQARTFYHSNESQSTYEHNSELILPYQQDVQFVCRMPVSYRTYNPIYIERGRYLSKPQCNKQRPQNRDQEYRKSEPHVPILKMATISPRPGKQNEKVNPSLKVRVPNCTSKEIEERKAASSKMEKELACSPIFQILGELPRAG